MLTTVMETLPDGKQLRVARLGSGPPLVLLHGYPDNLQIWSALAPHLAQQYTVIAFDWPGMGYSDSWPGGVTPTHQAERLLTLLDNWGLERVGVAGMDMGGQPALAFAARHPQRISRLVVMNSLLYADEKTSWEIRLLRKFGLNRTLLRKLPWLVFHRAEHTFMPRGKSLPLELRTDLWESFRKTAVRNFVVRLCAAYQGTLHKLPSLYSQITCPTLVLWAGADRHFPPVHATRLHNAIPGSALEILAGAQHWMMWTRADEVAMCMLKASGEETSSMN